MSKLFVQVERVEDLMGRVDNYFGEEQVMTEYIKREDLLDLYDLDGLEVENAKVPLDVVIQNIKDMPSADVVKRKKGKWINYKCSECGEPIPISKVTLRGEVVWERDQKPNFCPNCGAKMESEEK